MFRFPKDDARASVDFYQAGYSEGMTTDIPDEATLAVWLGSCFVGTEKDLSEKIRIVRALTTGTKLLDYGCSWGYGVVQFRMAGFDAIGYEIGRSRAEFGRRRCGVTIFTSREALLHDCRATFDVIFTNHVLEHLAAPAMAFVDFSSLLRPGGVLVAFTPNGGGYQARAQGTRWGPLIGEKHPLAIDATFLRGALESYGFAAEFASSPYASDLRLVGDVASDSLGGDELLTVGRLCAPVVSAS